MVPRLSLFVVRGKKGKIDFIGTLKINQNSNKEVI